MRLLFWTVPLLFAAPADLAWAQASNFKVQARDIPTPVYGVTLDNVANKVLSGTIASLQQMPHFPTSRVVFDAQETADYYLPPIVKLRPATYIMGQLADSTDMSEFTLASYQARAKSYLKTLGANVDIWEIGNEMNGGWLGANAFEKSRTAFEVMHASGARTAFTFFYEGEPNDPQNCIDGAGHDMFTWIQSKFQLNLPPGQRDPAGEAFRLGLDQVLISWYPQGCNNLQPDWTSIFTELARIFPNSKVGFGEIGTARPQNGSLYEKNLIQQYYPLAQKTPLPASFIGGYFWWNFVEEMVPSTKTPLLEILNESIR